MNTSTIIGKMELPDDMSRNTRVERCTCCNASLPYGGEVFGDDVLCPSCAVMWAGEGHYEEGDLTDLDDDVAQMEQDHDGYYSQFEEEASVMCHGCGFPAQECDCEAIELNDKYSSPL